MKMAMAEKVGNGWITVSLVLVAGLLVIPTPSRGQSGSGSPREGLPIDALAATVWVEEFDVSPDGNQIAYKSAKAGTYDIWIAGTAGGEPTRLTDMPGREMLPKFSPDGRWIVFEADRGGVNVRDLYLVPADGGDVVQLTDNPLNDSGAMWSPDSAKIYFSTGMFWDSSIAEVDIATREIRRVRSGGGASLSPDGKMLVFTGNRKPDDDDQSNRDIYVAPLGEGEARPLTPDTLNSLDSAPSWSPDGTKIAFISDRNGWNNLGVIDVGTGQTRMLLTEEIEHSEPRWSPDGEWISFTKNLDYQYHIFKIPAEGGEAMQLTQRGGVNGGSSATGQTRGMHQWHPDGNEIVYYHSDPTMTGDVWIMSDSGDNARQITNHQPAALGDPDLFVWPEFIEYKSFDGREVAGLVYKPKGSRAGDRLPALFFFRANSNGQHPVQWHPYIQYFVSRGYLVFAPNFRGSTGRGKDYRQSVFTHGGDHDLRDAFLGMDRLARRRMGGHGTGGRVRRVHGRFLHDDGSDEGSPAIQGRCGLVRVHGSGDAIDLRGDGRVEQISHRSHTARKPGKLLQQVDHVPRRSGEGPPVVSLRARRLRRPLSADRTVRHAGPHPRKLVRLGRVREGAARVVPLETR